jgi:hypothetical protein
VRACGFQPLWKPGIEDKCIRGGKHNQANKEKKTMQTDTCIYTSFHVCLWLDLLYCLLSTEWPFHRSFRLGLLLFVWAQMTSPRKISSFLLLFFFSDDFEDRKKGTKHLMLTNNLVQVKLVSIIVLSLLSLIFPT